jgi:hypothetical protein
MAKHKTFTVATNVKVYFCDPHSPWQRGTKENTNRLLRQYLPKRTDLSSYTQSQLDQIAVRLYQRPRKLWDFTRLRANFAQALRRPVELTAETGQMPYRDPWIGLSCPAQAQATTTTPLAGPRATSNFFDFCCMALYFETPVRHQQPTNQMELGNLTIGWIF